MPPAAFAPAATPRPNSPPIADDIALDTAWLCEAAGFVALAAEFVRPFVALDTGLAPPSIEDSGPIPLLAAPLSGELPPPGDGIRGSCGICGGRPLPAWFSGRSEGFPRRIGVNPRSV